MKLLSPSAEYLALAAHEPRLLSLWCKADQINRRFGNRKWDQYWYGFGSVPFGFKQQIQPLVGWGTAAGVDDSLRTHIAFNTVYQELVSVLQRSRRVTEGQPLWLPPSEAVDLATGASLELV